MDHSKQHYYCAKKTSGMTIEGEVFYGCIFHYDPTGNYQKIVWDSNNTFETAEEAIDDVVEYIEQSELEQQVGSIELGE